MGIKLTVFFEGPCWVGVFERSEVGKLETARVVFGAESKDYEVCEYIRLYYDKLVFSRSLETGASVNRRINPKRLQRKIRQEVTAGGIGTKARQAIKLEQETSQQEHKIQSKADRAARKTRKFKLRQAKKKEKQKGH
jgi:hypothetical protein